MFGSSLVVFLPRKKLAFPVAGKFYNLQPPFCHKRY